MSWADEISVGFARQPVSVYIATIDREIAGFSAYECTRRGFFGPTRVVEAAQHRNIGKALLLAALWSLREMGACLRNHRRHAVHRFYQKTVGAIVIPDSDPGIYVDLLKMNKAPGPKGSLIIGMMRDFNRDTLGFVTRCRDYGDVVHTRIPLHPRLLSLQPADIESLLTTNAKTIKKHVHFALRSFIVSSGMAS